MSRDELYKQEPGNRDFCFSEQVAEVFDDMLIRSIPNYRQVVEMIGLLLEKSLRPGDTVCDLGCSTGTTLLSLARRLAHLDLHFRGIDNSPAMIAKAVAKAALYSTGSRIRFEEQDICEADFNQVGAVILQYTLQFIRPIRRLEFLKKIHAGLRSGGLLIISEKVICHHPQLNRDFIDIYLDFKRSMGYSELEISRKREALENVLIPFSIEENRSLLREAGFAAGETFSQWFNFVSMVAIRS